MKPAPLPAFLIAYSDSDFTNPHEAMLAAEPKDCRGDFTHMGAKYWGFESRRHVMTRALPDEQALAYDHDAHDWLRIGLKQRALVRTITISTKWYTANQVRAVSVYLRDGENGRETRVLDRQTLNPDADHSFNITPTAATECRVECYYDGGISRINFFGDVLQQPPAPVNLLEGAKLTHVSNEHYGKPDRTVTADRGEMHMVGWESARTGFGERALFHLKKPAVIGEVVVDTYLHRLNAPLSAHVYGVNWQDADTLMKSAPRWKAVFSDGREVIPDDFRAYMLEQKYRDEKAAKFKIKLHLPAGSAWQPILPFGALTRDTFHRFRDLTPHQPVTHVLYMHYPHGGIHALRMFGVETD